MYSAKENPEQADFDPSQYYYNREGNMGLHVQQSLSDRNYQGFSQSNNFSGSSLSAGQNLGILASRSVGVANQSGIRSTQNSMNMMDNGQSSQFQGGLLRPQANGNGGFNGNNLNGMYGSSGQPMLQRMLSDNSSQFDPSNFPVLPGGNLSSQQQQQQTNINNSQQQQQQSILSRMTPSPASRDVDFTILNEDFPALPGSHPSLKQQEPLTSGNQSAFNLLSSNQQQISGNLMSNGDSGGIMQNGLVFNSQNAGSLSTSVGQGGINQINPGGFSNGNNLIPGSSAVGSMNPSRPSGPSFGHQQFQLQLSNTPVTGASLDTSSSSAGGLAMGSGLGGLNLGGQGGALGAGVSAVTRDAKYGLMGLLDVIRMTDRDLNTLALGSDLTTYGLNLTSGDCLYATFSSPFIDTPSQSEPNFNIPACYAMNSPNLRAEHLFKFQIETLFYMFYELPRDLLQAYAAQELYRREWRFHGEIKVWMKARSPQELMNSHPTVSFVYFDVSSWEVRLFTAQFRGNIAAGMLTVEDIQIRQGGPGGQGGIPLSHS